jgi:hypothetical protein
VRCFREYKERNRGIGPPKKLSEKIVTKVYNIPTRRANYATFEKFAIFFRNEKNRPFFAALVRSTLNRSVFRTMYGFYFAVQIEVGY